MEHLGHAAPDLSAGENFGLHRKVPPESKRIGDEGGAFTPGLILERTKQHRAGRQRARQRGVDIGDEQAEGNR